jgi:UDP-N-acetylmuramate--alanine ligase
MVGIAGAGMRSLAAVLDAAGWSVSGSDPNGVGFFESRFNVHAAHRRDAIGPGIDLLVYSDAVPVDNCELVRARELRIETLSYPQALARLMQERQGMAIAGTHGKSTTTAMAAEIVATAGLDPTVVCGAVPLGKSSGGRLGRGRWMLAEACEYQANFRHLKPRVAAILGIEADHFDCFQSEDELERAFADFARTVPAEGLVLARADCEATRRATLGIDATVESFGLGGHATWRASELRERRGLYCFRVRCRERTLCEVKLNVPGLHNVANALAAAALASHAGASGTAVRAGLERFTGVGRRLELVSEAREIAILDDYAHHPTAVRATLNTVRQMYPGRRVWCVFEPHQASRTSRLIDEFTDSLRVADKIIVTDIFRAREGQPLAGEITAEALVARIESLGADALHLASAAEIQDHLRNWLRAGDVLVTLGAGDIGKVAHDLGQGFRTFRKAG